MPVIDSSACGVSGNIWITEEVDEWSGNRQPLIFMEEVDGCELLLLSGVLNASWWLINSRMIVGKLPNDGE